MKLLLPQSLQADMEAAARTAFPGECCGLIEGIWDGAVAHVLALHPIPNLAARQDRFEIDPAVHFAALRAARDAGHALIGCYHSHPHGKAEPSAHDLAGAGEDGFVWLIAALASGEAPTTCQAFVYRDGGFSRIGFVTGADLVTSSLKLRN
jgi:proteasome lid subunit RPN8/RPN11